MYARIHRREHETPGHLENFGAQGARVRQSLMIDDRRRWAIYRYLAQR